MKKKINFESIANEIITKKEVLQIARETKFLQRGGGTDPFDFLFTIIFKISASNPLSLGNLTMFLNVMISRTALHKKYNAFAVLFFQKVLQKIILKRIAAEVELEINGLENFSNVFIIDSSSWDISKKLKSIFPSCGGAGSAANCKLQFCYDYLTGEIYIHEETEGKSPDQKYSINLLKIVKEKSLFLFDLGYWKFETFFGINSKKAFF